MATSLTCPGLALIVLDSPGSYTGGIGNLAVGGYSDGPPFRYRSARGHSLQDGETIKIAQSCVYTKADKKRKQAGYSKVSETHIFPWARRSRAAPVISVVVALRICYRSPAGLLIAPDVNVGETFTMASVSC